MKGKDHRAFVFIVQGAWCNGFSHSGLPSAFAVLHPTSLLHIGLNNVYGLTGYCNRACVGADIAAIFVFHVDSADTVVLQMWIHRWFPLFVGG